MPSINFDLLKHWFDQLADLSEADRLRFLREAQDIDENTRNHLLQLLQADAELIGFTARSAIRVGSAPALDESMLGQRIGAYQIDSALGRGGRWYRTRRFISRHRLAVSAAAAVLIVATFGTLTWFNQYRATIEQQSRADQMTSLIMEAIEAADPGGGNGKDMLVRDLFDRIIDKTLSDQGIKGEQHIVLLTSLSKIQRRLGFAQKALKVIEHIDSKDLSDADQILVLRSRAEGMLSLGNYEEAQKLVTQALRIARSDEDVVDFRLTLALLDYNQGNVVEAVTKLEGLNMTGASFAALNERRLQLGRAYIERGRYKDSRRELELALNEQLQSASPNERSLLDIYGVLQNLYMRESNDEESRKYAEKILALTEKLYSSESPRYAAALNSIASTLWSAGKPEEAIKKYDESLSILERTRGASHPEVAKAYFNLSGLYHETGDQARAIEGLEKAVAVAEKAWLPTDSNLLLFRMVYASQLVEGGDLQAAVKIARTAKLDMEASADKMNNAFYYMASLVQAMGDFERSKSPSNRSAVLDAYRATKDAAIGPTSKSVLAGLVEVMAKQGVEVELVPLSP